MFPRLTPYQRGTLVGAASLGASGVRESTVRYILAQALSRKKSGRPKSISDRDERHIIITTRLEPKITNRELIEMTGVKFHCKTIYRVLKE